MSKKHKFLAVYEEYLIITNKRLKPQSYSNFKYNFEANILSYFADYYIEDLAPIDIANWQDFILSKNFSNSHNKGLFSMLKKFLDYSIRYGFDSRVLLDVYPFREKIEKKKAKFYTQEEFNKFIACVDNNLYKQFFNFMFYAGTRPGEAMALRFSDLEDNCISITKTMDEHGTREIGTPKNHSSIRDIFIDDTMKEDLLKLKNEYIAEYKEKDFDYYIFGGKKPLSPTTINRYKKKACEKAEIEPIKLHQFRHSHATLLLNSGIVIHEISKRLGHSKVSTTLNIYTHSNLEQEKKVLNTLNSIRG